MLRGVLVVFLLLSGQAGATPRTITLGHTGRLLDSGDQPVTREGLPLSFSIWSDRESTQESLRVWDSGSACPVDVRHGYYATMLGAGTGPGACGDLRQASVYCEMLADGGGWTRVFWNFMSDSTAGMNMIRNGTTCSTRVLKPSGAGWWLGHGNTGNTLTDAVGLPAHEWRIELVDPVVVLDATELWETAVFLNHSGYDNTQLTTLVTSSPFQANGEFASQYFDGTAWRWFAFYGGPPSVLQPFNRSISSAGAGIKAPYMRWAYQSGGPGDCNEANSDGFYMSRWAVLVR